MKIKERPEDFVVKELLPDGFVKSKGKYIVYELTKSGVTTQYCLNKIGKAGYCGLKDKHAITTQYVTVRGELNIKDKHFTLRKIGYSDEWLQRGSNIGNKFRITVTVTPEEKELIKKNESRVRNGFINYYGKQRTGKELIHKSVVHYLLEEDYKNALLRYYINKSRNANSKLKKAYKECFKHWPDTKKCYELLKGLEKNITIRPLRESDFFKAVKRIPRNELELLIAGYQSMLWNDNPAPVLPVIKISGLGVKARKGKREVIVKPTNLKIKYEQRRVIISFSLPSGSYATVLLKELIKQS